MRLFRSQRPVLVTVSSSLILVGLLASKERAAIAAFRHQEQRNHTAKVKTSGTYYPDVPVRLKTHLFDRELPHQFPTSSALRRWTKELKVPADVAPVLFGGAKFDVVVFDCFSGRLALAVLIYAASSGGRLLVYVNTEGIDIPKEAKRPTHARQRGGDLVLFDSRGLVLGSVDFRNGAAAFRRALADATKGR